MIFCKSLHFRISDMKILFFTLFSLFLNETESVVQVERFPQLRYLTIAAGVLFWGQGTILMVHSPMRNVNIPFQPFFISFKSRIMKLREKTIFEKKDWNRRISIFSGGKLSKRFSKKVFYGKILTILNKKTVFISF